MRIKPCIFGLAVLVVAPALGQTFDANGNLLTKKEDPGLSYQWKDPRTGQIVTKSFPPSNLHMRQVERRGDLIILEVEREIGFAEKELQKTPSNAETEGTSTDLAASCLSAARKMSGYKDPDSLKIEGTPRLGFTPYTGEVRRSVSIDVNGKNSYGAYAGAKPVICIFAADNQTVLEVLN